MSLTAAHLDALVATGATAEQIVALVKADMAERDARAAARRAKDVDRQRRHRSRDVTRCHADNDPAPLNVSPTPPSNNPPISPIVSSETITPILKPEHVVEAWNDMASPIGLSLVRDLTPQRRRKLKTQIGARSIQDFTEAISAVPRSPFLRGENDRGWKATFDWMLEPRNFTKLLEGTYER